VGASSAEFISSLRRSQFVYGGRSIDVFNIVVVPFVLRPTEREAPAVDIILSLTLHRS
jgi:hypothetical protein